MNPTNQGTERDILNDVEQGAKSVKNTLADAANKTKEFGRTAINKVEEGRQTAASSLQSAASTLHDRADNLPGVETAGNIAHSTANKLESVAGYMRDHDTKQMMADVEGLVKKNPGQSLLVALAFGFLLGRALRND